MSDLTEAQSSLLEDVVEMITATMVHKHVVTVKIMAPEASIRTSISVPHDEIDYREHIVGRIEYLSVFDVGTDGGWQLQIRFQNGMGTVIRVEHLKQVIFQVHTPPRATRITGEN